MKIDIKERTSMPYNLGFRYNGYAVSPKGNNRGNRYETGVKEFPVNCGTIAEYRKIDGVPTLLLGSLVAEECDAEYLGRKKVIFYSHFTNKITIEDGVTQYEPEDLELIERAEHERVSEMHVDAFTKEVLSNNEYLDDLFTRMEDVTATSDMFYRINSENVIKIGKNLAMFESVCKTGGLKMAVKLLSSDDINIDFEEKKMKKAIAMPANLITEMRKLKLEQAFSDIQEICSYDPNNGQLLLDWIRAVRKITKSTDTWHTVRFIATLAEIMKAEKYSSFKNLLSYVTKQMFYYDEFQIDQDVVRAIKDTIDMCVENGAEFDPHAQNVHKYHSITARNCTILKESRAEEFDTAVNKYKHLEKEYAKSGYGIYVPENEKDLFNEGATLKHCVASYRDKIIDKGAKVLFLRKIEDKKTPFVTIEVDENLDFIQIKQEYDEDVTDEEVLETLKQWRKEQKAKM